jgi:uncharacterized protein YndB with AHSA1/START domain
MQTAMLIRRPAADVFEAFVDPAVTTQFWFTRGSGRLEAGERVQWDWEMYGVSVTVTVKDIEAGRRILIEWPGTHAPTTVEWTFSPRGDDTTFVTVLESGFAGDGDELVGQIANSTEGFSLVLAGAKAFLEHGVRLNLVGDRFPEGIVGH